MKALIVAEPWIGMILRGEKTWEMRPQRTHHRGLLALIPKGSGKVIGVAHVLGCLPPLSLDGYAANFDRHRVPPAEQDVASRRWPVPWLLGQVRRLQVAVSYRHKPGAQSNVLLSDDEADAILAQFGDVSPQPVRRSAEPLPAGRSTSVASLEDKVRPGRNGPARTRVVGRIDGDTAAVPITGGNLGNGHIYLRTILDFFPDDAVGGSDKTQAGQPILLRFDPGAPHPVATDIAGPNRASNEKRSAHYFFRERGALREFFARSKAQPGDEVRIRRTGDRSYCVSLARRA